MYSIESEKMVAQFLAGAEGMVLRDAPQSEQPIQVTYLNTVVGMFLRLLVKVYSPEDVTEEERARLRKYLERILEAKDAMLGKEPKR